MRPLRWTTAEAAPRVGPDVVPDGDTRRGPARWTSRLAAATPPNGVTPVNGRPLREVVVVDVVDRGRRERGFVTGPDPIQLGRDRGRGRNSSACRVVPRASRASRAAWAARVGRGRGRARGAARQGRRHVSTPRLAASAAGVAAARRHGEAMRHASHCPNGAGRNRLRGQKGRLSPFSGQWWYRPRGRGEGGCHLVLRVVVTGR